MKKFIENFGKLTVALALIFAISCNSNDVDDVIDDIINEGPSLDDGYYIIGSAVSADTTDANKLVAAKVSAPDFGSQDRSGFYETFVYMGAGSFNFIKVDGDNITSFGAAPVEGTGGTPAITIYQGEYSDNTSGTSPVSGKLVHVSLDEKTGQYILVPIDYYEVIGDATEGGWGTGQELAQKSASASKVEFEATNVVLRAGSFKIRYNSVWNIDLDADDCDEKESACLNFFTNFGGTVDEMEAGGSNFSFSGEGAYTVNLTYTPGEGNSMALKLTRTGDVEPLPTYPETIYIIGAGTTYDWPSANPNEKTEAVMHTVPDADGLYWKILSLKASSGFKLAGAGWANPNLGFAEITEFDSEGVTASNVEGNLTVANDGIYMVVLDMRDDKVKLSIKEAAVYGIGDAFPTDPAWSAGAEANKFTLNFAEGTAVSPALGGNGDIRIYAAHSWISDWWKAEFVLMEGKIEYRNNGGDQSRVAGTTGQVVTLKFNDNTGSIQ